MPDLRGGTWATLKTLGGILLAVASFAGGWAYKAGQFAEKTETERMMEARDHMRIDELEKAAIRTEMSILQIQKDQNEIKLGLKDLAQQKKGHDR